MTVAYLVDTDWIIDRFKGVEGVTRKLEEFRPAGGRSAVSRATAWKRPGPPATPARDPGLDKTGFMIYNLPRAVRARIDDLQMIASRFRDPRRLTSEAIFVAYRFAASLMLANRLYYRLYLSARRIHGPYHGKRDD